MGSGSDAVGPGEWKFLDGSVVLLANAFSL